MKRNLLIIDACVRQADSRTLRIAGPVLFITTRGMDIKTGSAREQATPYLKALGSLWNWGELTTIAARNMDYCGPSGLEEKTAACIAEGLELARTW